MGKTSNAPYFVCLKNRIMAVFNKSVSLAPPNLH